MTGHAGHDHAHDHGHGHPHAPANFGRAFALGIGLNLVFVAIEAGYGFIANSMALLADAGHNLSDVLGLVGWRAGSVATQQAAPETILFRAVAYGYTVAMTSITTAPASDKPERKGRLSAADWAQAALDLIAENGGGADAVEAGVGRRGGAKGDVTWPRPAREAVVQAR